MALSIHGAFSGFIPAATGQVISFIRDPKKYRINDYAQLVPTSKPVGVYNRIGVDQPVRMVNSEANVWADGDNRPTFKENRLKFDQVEFATKRYTYGFEIGWETIENADMKLLVMHSDMAMNQMMIARTNRALALLETSSNWGTSTGNVNTLNGGAGHWRVASADPNSPNYLAIKKTLDAVALRVMMNTNNRVNVYEDGVLKLLISPELAVAMSQSPEIHDYLKRSERALDQIKGRKPGQNALWGLPDSLYGWDIEVEPTVYVNQNPNSSEAIGSEATTTGNNPARRWAKSDSSAVVLSRVGGLDGQYGAQNFSTLQIYYYGKEADVETFDEPKHRKTEGYVTEHVKEVLASPASGFLITGL